LEVGLGVCREEWLPLRHPGAVWLAMQLLPAHLQVVLPSASAFG
jgi:hypothetical protein